MDLMRFVVFLAIFLILFVFGIGLSVNFPHSADEKYADVFKSSVVEAQEIPAGTDLSVDPSEDEAGISEEKDTDDGSEEEDTDDGFMGGLKSFFGELIDILKKPFELVADLLEKVISGLKTVSDMISDVFTRISDLFRQISENVSKSVDSVRRIPVFGDVIATILLTVVSILIIFFIIKIIDVLLP